MGQKLGPGFAAWADHSPQYFLPDHLLLDQSVPLNLLFHMMAHCWEIVVYELSLAHCEVTLRASNWKISPPESAFDL